MKSCQYDYLVVCLFDTKPTEIKRCTKTTSILVLKNCKFNTKNCKKVFKNINVIVAAEFNTFAILKDEYIFVNKIRD
jgi:hypothetical protein